MPPEPSTDGSGPPVPAWALGQAMHNREDADLAGADERARELVRDFEHDQHDENDDPDQGGEA